MARYIITKQGRNRRDIWNNKRKKWQWFYDSSNRPYKTVGHAQRVLDDMIERGWVKPNTIDEIGDDAIIYEEKYFWERIQVG